MNLVRYIERFISIRDELQSTMLAVPVSFSLRRDRNGVRDCVWLSLSENAPDTVRCRRDRA